MRVDVSDFLFLCRKVLVLIDGKMFAANVLNISAQIVLAENIMCLLWLVPVIAMNLMAWVFASSGTLWPVLAAGDAGIIGGADGPTQIITATRALGPLETLLEIGVPLILLVLCVILAVRVRRLEKKLK